MAMIENLTDAQNFGQWITKINEVIDAYNNSLGVIDYTSGKITQALKNGQIGNTLTTPAKNSYDDYIVNGVYYVPMSVNNRPENKNFDANLYVATNGRSITQLAILIDTEPKLYLRKGVYDSTTRSFTFNGWYAIPSRNYNDATYLMLKGSDAQGRKVVGSTTFANVNTSTLNVNSTATFYDLVKIDKSGNDLYISNNGNTTIFDAKNNKPQVIYTIKDDTIVDNNGNVVYYLFENKFITYTNVYYIQRNKDTFTSDENGNDRNPYYIQEDNTITLQKDGRDVRGHIEGNVIYKDNGIKYIIVNDIAYTYEVQFFLKDNIVYADSNCRTPRYYIREHQTDRKKQVFVEKLTKYYLHRDPLYPAADYVIASLDEDGEEIKFYIDDGVYYTESTYENPVLYQNGNSISTDPEGVNVLYYIDNDKVIEELTPYYLEDGVVYYTPEEGAEETTPVIMSYVMEETLVRLVDKILYRQYVLDTISEDEEGTKTVFYLQNNSNTITSDKEGHVVELYYHAQLGVVTKKDESLRQNVLYYVKDDILRTQNVVYYIQNDNTVTSDEEGLLIHYKISGNNVLQKTSPITINMEENVAHINGTSQYAQFLKKTALTHSFTSGNDSLAVSGKGVLDLYNYMNKKYMPYEGGTFTGIVVHQDDLRMGRNNNNQPCKIYSYSDLDILCLSKLSIVANNDWCELYLDRINEPSSKDIPCVIGARTRTGTTSNTIGDLVYALGSIEFTEDRTVIRLRKRNLTRLEEDDDEKTDISLLLERDDNGTSFRPSIDRVVSLGTGAMRYSHIYSASGEISTSDKNLKTDIQEIDEKLLDRWKYIDWKSFKFKSSVEEKGIKARIHTGLIAQDVATMIGGSVNPTDYGFFCVDSWDDIYDIQYITIPPKYDPSGVMIEPEQRKKIKTLKKKAGNQLSLRYQEVQAIENAYLRREIKNLREEIDELKKLIMK